MNEVSVDRISSFAKTLKNPRFSGNDLVHEVLFEAARTDEMKYIDWLLSSEIQKNLHTKQKTHPEPPFDTSPVLLRACWFAAERVTKWLFSQTTFPKPNCKEKFLMGSGKQNAFMCTLDRAHANCLDILFEHNPKLDVSESQADFSRILMNPQLTYVLLKRNAYHRLPENLTKTTEILLNLSLYGRTSSSAASKKRLTQSLGMVMQASSASYKNNLLSSLIQSFSEEGARFVFENLSPSEKSEFCKQFKREYKDQTERAAEVIIEWDSIPDKKRDVYNHALRIEGFKEALEKELIHEKIKDVQNERQNISGPPRKM